MKKDQKHIFDQFTKRSSIVKAGSVELIPQGKTLETFENLNMNAFDEKVRGIIDDTTPYINAVIRLITNTALESIEDAKINFSILDQEEKKKRTAAENQISKTIVKHVEDACKKITGKGISKLNSADFLNKIPELLHLTDLSKNEIEDSKELLEKTNGKATFFTPLLVNRATALQISVPRRVIENFDRYLENARVINKCLNSPLRDKIIMEYPEAEYYTDINQYSNILTQSSIDKYNLMYSGIENENKVVKKGFGMLIEEYNNDKTHPSLPKMKQLYKQILMPRAKAFSISSIESDEDVKVLTRESTIEALEASKDIRDAFNKLEPVGLVVKYNNLHSVSQYVSGNHNIIPDSIKNKAMGEFLEAYENAKTKAERTKLEKKMGDIDEALKNNQYTFEEIESTCEDPTIFNSFAKAMTAAYAETKSAADDIFKKLDSMEEIRDSSKNTALIREYFDIWTKYRKVLVCLYRRDVATGDNAFYNVFDDAMYRIKTTVDAQKKILAYITRTPADACEKNGTVFGMTTRAAIKWMPPEGILEADRCTVIDRDGKYYLLILLNGKKNIKGNGSDKAFAVKNVQDDSYFKCFGKIFTDKKDANKSISAKDFFEKNPDAKEYVLAWNMKKPITITRDMYDLYINKNYKSDAVERGLSEKEAKECATKFIALCQEYAKNYNEFQYFDFNFKDPKSYESYNDFTTSIGKCSYYKEWISVEDNVVNELVANGDALIFLISTRDMYNGSNKKNPTLFREALNTDNTSITLNSKPRFYLRKSSIANPIVHRKGSILVGRNDKNGNKIPDSVYFEIYNYLNNKSNATFLSAEAKRYINENLVCSKKALFDIVKDKRYTKDQFSMTFSVTKNHDVLKQDFSLNSEFKELKDMNILSLIRTDADLVYYAVTDPNGNVIEKGSYNVIDGVDYWARLKELAILRRTDKSSNWKYDRTIKNERDGYITRVVAEIARKALNYNAVIVCEKISDDIKDKYSALDNTVFKKFETILTNRLEDLSFNDIPLGECGSHTNPYQLCSESSANEFQDGIVSFVNPKYTKNVDAETGFVCVFNFDTITTTTQKELFLSKFESIKYDSKKNRFAFTFDYNNFITKGDIKKTKWTAYIGGPKTSYDRTKKETSYMEETASEICEMLKKNHSLDDDFAKLAMDGELKPSETKALYDAFVYGIKGIIFAHDDKRKLYISPITLKEYDFTEHSAICLAKKYIWQQIDKKDRGNWEDSIAD